MSKRRVVITGLGAVTPVGIGSCEATVNGEIACTAELIFAVQQE